MPLAPQPHVTEAERDAGLRCVVVEGAYSSATTALTSGVILTALALHLGASNFAIGLLASGPFLAQLLQGPAVLLIERWRARKWISVWSSVVGRSMLILMAAAAFLPHALGLSALVVGQAVLCGMGAIGACAWNAWMRDLAPEERLGHVFARRTIYTTAVSLVASLLAAFALDRTMAGSPMRSLAFAALYGAGCATGLWSALIVARIPEPIMPPTDDAPLNLRGLLRAPLADRNFRRLIVFLSSWQFAINLATPFITVFVVRQLGFDMTLVVLLTVVSQVANLAMLKSWGLWSDRFSNKSVLLVAAPVYIACIVALIGASDMNGRITTALYLGLLHLLMGAAVAGVTLASANIALKLSPKGSSTAYVATNALVTSFAAGIAPILGGLFADFFASRRLELLIRWVSPNGNRVFAPLLVSHWDFYFVMAGILGLFALHRLSLVSEEGEIERSEMIQEIINHTRRSVRNLSTVVGLRSLTIWPGGLLRDARRTARLARMRRARR